MSLDKRVELIRLALLASYNEDRPANKRIANEDAPEIWTQRAQNVLSKLEKLWT